MFWLRDIKYFSDVTVYSNIIFFTRHPASNWLETACFYMRKIIWTPRDRLKLSTVDFFVHLIAVASPQL
jgi:hypothetical protein